MELIGGNEMTYRKNGNNPEEELMIPPNRVKRKLDGMVGSVPPVSCSKVLDGELTHQ